MPDPELKLAIHNSGQDYTLFLDKHPLTRAFNSSEETILEFDRLYLVIAAARIEALKVFVAKYGIFERPGVILVRDPRSS